MVILTSSAAYTGKLLKRNHRLKSVQKPTLLVVLTSSVPRSAQWCLLLTTKSLQNTGDRQEEPPRATGDTGDRYSQKCCFVSRLQLSVSPDQSGVH